MTVPPKSADLQFFVPHAKKKDYELVYGDMVTKVQDTFKWRVTGRRISSLVYIDGKRTIKAQVGELEQFENNYEISAILESNVYVVMTRSSKGEQGPMILVDGKAISTITDFKDRAAS